MMNDDQIFQKLEEIYNTKKGKKFISHLLRSFFPVGKGTYINEVEESKKNKLRCCITGTKLITKGNLLKAHQKISPNEFTEYIRSGLILDEQTGEPKVKVNHPAKKHLPNGALLGIECKGSDKFLCQPAYEQLYNFYASKILRGDGHMKWLARNMMAKNGIKYFKKKGISIKKKEERTLIKNINKPHKMSLGQMADLESLKKKLEADGEK